MKILAALSVSAVLAAGFAAAQDTPQTPPQSGSSSSSSSAPPGPSEHRFSGGVTLSVLGLGMIPGRTSTVNNNSEMSTQYQTQNASERIGYGLTLQARVKGHFYLNVSGLLHRTGYQENTTVTNTVTQVLNGVTYPVVTTTSTHEDTRARLIDIPALVRYYGTGKRPGSPRWFVELGGEYQTLNNIRTSLSSTDEFGNVTCCTNTPAVPQHHSIEGAVVGAGIQFTDEFGIHVVPEVRYIRWMQSNFDNLSTTMNRNQVEADISITF